ncbi:MAG: autotransporter domain-containing protein [Chlorobium sp.]|nr:MAG: autotransporter domain-containing protein [Chlorobium sp.]
MVSAVVAYAMTGIIFSSGASAQTTVTAADISYRDQQAVINYSWYVNSITNGSGTIPPDLSGYNPILSYPTVPPTVISGVNGTDVYLHTFGLEGINLSNDNNNRVVPSPSSGSFTNSYSDFFGNGYISGTTTTSWTVTTYYAPNWYAVLTASGSTVTADGSGYAIKTDTGVGSTLNLTGTNQFNGIVQLGTTSGSLPTDGNAYLTSGTTTFNGDLYANLYMGGNGAPGTNSKAIFTTAASTIAGNITESTPSSDTNTTIVEFQGNNTVNGTVTVDNVHVSGQNVIFNGNVTGALSFLNSAGTAYFGGGSDLTGNVSYAGNDAALTLSNGSNITYSIDGSGYPISGSGGDVVGAGTNNGTLTFEGSSEVSGTVGPIKSINVKGGESLVQLNTESGTTSVNTLAITADKAVVATSGLLSANAVTMDGHFSKLKLMDITSFTPLQPSSIATPESGAYTLPTLPYEAKGMVGTLNFGTYNTTINVPATGTQGKGTLEIGDNVNVTFSTNPALGINVVNGNNATLVIAGSSTIGGNLGTLASSSNTFNRIWAGSASDDNDHVPAIDTFQNDIYVGVNSVTAATAGSLSGTDRYTGYLHVGSGIVNLNGDLHGNLVIGSEDKPPVRNGPVSVEGSAYTTYGDGGVVSCVWADDGTVNIAHNKTVTGTITTNTDGTGFLNFMGSSNYSGTIGGSGASLNAVTFNSASTGSATTGFTATIGHNVYATTVTIGNSDGELKATALADISGTFDYAGASSMRGWTGGTVANIGSGVTQLGGYLVLDNEHDAINFGVAHVSATTFTTNGGALSFTVNSLNAAATIDGSSLLTLTEPSTEALTMTGTEKVQVNYVGSLANGSTYTLIDSTTSGSGWAIRTDTDAYGQVFDNSFSINSSVSQVGGDLIVTANRTGGGLYPASENYIQKSGTVGSFSNNAAIVLGGIAAAGSQSGDMVEVIQKIDIDNYGYGNNQANLATQMRRLAPIANGSIIQSAFSAFRLSLDALDMRLSAIRGNCCVSASDIARASLPQSGLWVKTLGSYGKQKQQGEYDGYNSTEYSVVAGFDGCVNRDLIVGLAGGYGSVDVDQQDFRDGDTMHINNYQLIGYLTYDLTESLYLDGAVSYGLNSYDGQRTAAIGRKADANFDGRQLGADLGVGYNFNLGKKTTLTPMVSVDYKQLKQDAYTETGAGAISLNIGEQLINRTRFGLGGRLATEWSGPDVSYRPEVAFHWYHDNNSLSKDIVSSFVGGGEAFTTPCFGSDANTWNLGAALTVSTKNTLSIQVRYDFDKRNDFTAHTGSLTAAWKF